MLRLTTLYIALATLAIVFYVHPTHAQVGAVDFCANSTFAPIVDSLSYPQGPNGGYFSLIEPNEALGEVFVTGATAFEVKVSRVAVLVSNDNNTQTSGEGVLELWTDDGAGFPNSLPGTLLASLGTFTPAGNEPGLVGLDVGLLNIFLRPATYYWLVVRSRSGNLRWSYSDFAFQFGCPPETEGRIGGRYAFSDTNTNATWDSVNLDQGFISFFAIDRSCNETLPTPTPGPSGTPVPSPSPGLPSPLPSPVLPTPIPSPGLPSPLPSPVLPTPIPSPDIPIRGAGRGRRAVRS